eukprot:Nk52_evm35s224 gene=Nk52_evmTU35s224
MVMMIPKSTIQAASGASFVKSAKSTDSAGCSTGAGATPLVDLSSLVTASGSSCSMYGKLEYQNVFGSATGRLSEALLNEALRSSSGGNKSVVIPCQDSAGVGLAFACLSEGVSKIVITIPEEAADDLDEQNNNVNNSIRLGDSESNNSSIYLLKNVLGVEFVRTPRHVAWTSSHSPYGMALKLAQQMGEGVVVLDQYAPSSALLMGAENIANELMAQLGTEENEKEMVVNVLVADCGCAGFNALVEKFRAFRTENRAQLIVGVTHKSLRAASGTKNGDAGDKLPKLKYCSQLGEKFFQMDAKYSPSAATTASKLAGFTCVEKEKSLDLCVEVDRSEAEMAFSELLRKGILCSPNGGALLSAVKSCMQKVIVDGVEKRKFRFVLYLSESPIYANLSLSRVAGTFAPINPAFSSVPGDVANGERDIGLTRRPSRNAWIYRGAAVGDLNLPIPVTVSSSAKCSDAYELMISNNFDNLPVVHPANKKLVGLVTKCHLEEELMPKGTGSTAPRSAECPVRTCMYSFDKSKEYIPITVDTPLAELDAFFETNSIAFVTDYNGWCVGLVTKADLLFYRSRLPSS